MATSSNGSPTVSLFVSPLNLHVLVAEDDDSNRLVVEGALALFACRYQCVADGQSAVQAVLGGGFDIVLMDYHLPVMNGQEATRAIRVHESTFELPRTPIVGLTGSAMAAEKAACMAAGMDHVLVKPYNFEHLYLVLKAFTRVMPSRDQPRAASGV